MRSGLASLCLVAALAWVPIGTTQALPDFVQATPVGLSGRLLFPRDVSLLTLDLQTGRMVEVATARGVALITSARWAPGGSQLAYALYQIRDQRVPVSEIFTAGADGADPAKVLSAEQANTFYESPVWSGDGTLLYYQLNAAVDGRRVNRIERLSIATGAREVVFEGSGPFDVSPDGRWLAVARNFGINASLLIVDLATGDRRELASRLDFDVISSARFDPTSSTILFAGVGPSSALPGPGSRDGLPLASLLSPVAHAHGFPQDIWSVSVAGGAPTRLLALRGDDPVPAWSPDGSHIAILSAEALVTMPAQGGSPTLLLQPGSSGTVDWSN